MARPKVLDTELVRLRINYSAADNAALDTLVAQTGEAKASHLRRALTRYLAELGLGISNPQTSVVPHPNTKETAR